MMLPKIITIPTNAFIPRNFVYINWPMRMEFDANLERKFSIPKGDVDISGVLSSFGTGIWMVQKNGLCFFWVRMDVPSAQLLKDAKEFLNANYG